MRGVVVLTGDRKRLKKCIREEKRAAAWREGAGPPPPHQARRTGSGRPILARGAEPGTREVSGAGVEEAGEGAELSAAASGEPWIVVRRGGTGSGLCFSKTLAEGAGPEAGDQGGGWGRNLGRAGWRPDQGKAGP